MERGDTKTLTQMFPQTKRRNAVQGGRPSSKRQRRRTALQQINPNQQANLDGKGKGKGKGKSTTRGGVVTRSKAGSSDGGIVCDDDVVLHLDGDEADASVEDGTADVDADASMTLDVSVVEADDEDSGDKSSTGEKSTGASRRSKRLRGQRAGKGLSAAKPRLTRSAAKKSATKGADAKGAAAAPGPTRRVTRSATAAGAGAAASASASASAGRPAKSASKGKGKGKGKASRGAPVAPGAPKMDVKAALERCRTLPDMRGPPELPPGIRDVYDQHRPAARYCAEYIEDIHSNLMRLEREQPVDYTYMHEVQTDITPEMRAIMVDWLVEVAQEYRLTPLTLHLCVKFIDRCLRMMPMARSKLQLLGCACMLIAAKLEEVFTPSVDEFVYISDNTYRREEILEMETVILRKMDFHLSVATPFHFLKRFLLAGDAETLEILLAHYICELTLQVYALLKFPASMISASSVLLSRLSLVDDPRSSYLTSEPAWTENHVHYTGYKRADLTECVKQLHKMHRGAPSSSLQAVREKYSHSPYMAVSKLKALPSCASF